MITKSTMDSGELMESMTGYEEQTIEERFGAMPDVLIATKWTTGLRALAMIVIVRGLKADDVKDPQGKAYKRVMEMTFKEVTDFFPQEADEPVPDEPVTPVGEDDSSAA